MDGTHYGNAMTEIALALAMAFFSLMVLTLVSMGAGGTDGAGSVARAASATGPVTARLVASKEADVPARARAARPGKPSETARPDDLLVIHWAGRFLDRELRPFDLSRLSPNKRKQGQRAVLALDPALPLAEALAARAQLPAANLVVAPLNAKWRRALERLTPSTDDVQPKETRK